VTGQRLLSTLQRCIETLGGRTPNHGDCTRTTDTKGAVCGRLTLPITETIANPGNPNGRIDGFPQASNVFIDLSWNLQR